MEKEKKSETSIGAAALRAAHQVLDGEPKILYDPVILRLLDPGLPAHILEREHAFNAPELIGLRSHIVLRSRFAEDCLHEAYLRGIRQYILLGAGMDTFAYRQPDWAQEMTIVEADHPASQAHKLQRLQEAGIALPSNLSFVSVDLENDPLASVLQQGRIDLGKPVFISCLGVLVYLNRETVDKVFGFVASLAGSTEFVFTYSQKKATIWQDLIGERAAALGEPFLTRLHPDELLAKLKALGFSHISFLEPEEARRLYYSNSKLPVPKNNSIVRCVLG